MPEILNQCQRTWIWALKISTIIRDVGPVLQDVDIWYNHAWNLSQCLRLCIHVRNVGFMSENLDLSKTKFKIILLDWFLQEVGILSGIFDRSPKNFGAAFVWRKIFWSSVSKFIKVLRLWKEYFKFSFCFLFFWQPWLICLTLLAPESATVITGNSDL